MGNKTQSLVFLFLFLVFLQNLSVSHSHRNTINQISAAGCALCDGVAILTSFEMAPSHEFRKFDSNLGNVIPTSRVDFAIKVRFNYESRAPPSSV